MKKFVVLLSSFLFLSFGFGIILAAQASGISNALAKQKASSRSLIQVDYQYCRNIRDECAEAWNKGSRKYYYCLREHGCRQYKKHHYNRHRYDDKYDYKPRRKNACKPIFRRCGDRYDYGTRGYHSCLKQYGCRDHKSYGDGY